MMSAVRLPPCKCIVKGAWTNSAFTSRSVPRNRRVSVLSRLTISAIRPGTLHDAFASGQADLTHHRSTEWENSAAHARGSESQERPATISARAAATNFSLQRATPWLRWRKVRTRIAETKRNASNIFEQRRWGVDQPR